MNIYLGKNEITFYDFLHSYNKYYEPKDIAQKKEKKWKKRTIEISVLVALILVVVYSYKNK